MMPAAKHFDPVLGVDIHIIQPPGPVPPVPVPHPFVGFIIDPFDYAPIIGATVLINGVYRALAGTGGKCVPPHIPIGGMFVKPPANECEMFMGSATVCVDGDAQSYLALPALSCQCIGMPPIPRLKKKGGVKSLVLPTSVVLPIPAGPPVLIGGPPTISLMALGMRVGMAALGKAFKKLAKSKIGKRIGAGFKKAKQKIFKKMKPGLLKCKVLKAEPVDITTGEVVVDQQDFSIPGRIPIQWNRHYGSHSDYQGVCGFGWETPADARLELDEDGVVLFYDGGPGATVFESLPDKGPVMEGLDGAVLDRTPEGLEVRLKGGLIYEFPRFQPGERRVLVDRMRDQCGNHLEFLRDKNGLAAIRESAGRRIEVVSRGGRISRMQLRHPEFREAHPLVRFDYDEAGDLVAVYDALDLPYRFAYRHHRLVRHIDRNGLSFYYEYDRIAPQRRCVHSWGDGGLYDYRFEYDDLLSETRVTDSLGHTSTIQLDAHRLPISETDPLGGKTVFEYDEFGRTTAVVDPGGHRTEYQYDERGNLLKLTRPDGTGILREYDGGTRVVNFTDPNGSQWRQEWDARGLLLSRINPLGAVSRYEYDERGQLVGFVNPNQARTTFRFDDAGNLTRLVDALGRATEFGHDPRGNIALRIDALGRRSVYAHDAKGRLTKVVMPNGASIACGYDGEDNLLRYVDENGAETRLEYCGLGEVKRRVQPDGHSVQYHYDTEERLVGITNQRGERHHLKRDALGRIVEEVDYWGQSRRYAYDAGGRVSSATDPLGRRVRFVNDPLGRILKKTLPEGLVESFSYDANGNLIETANACGSVKRVFDAAGRVVKEEQGPFTVENAYDANGNRVARHTSQGNSVAYELNALDQAVCIRIGQNEPIRIERDPVDRVIHQQLGSRLSRRFQYGSDGYLADQDVSVDDTLLFATHFEHDRVGHVTQRNDSQYGTDSYCYDPLGRITEHLDPQRRVTRYLHDPAGDRLRTRIGEGTLRSETGENLAGDGWQREGENEGDDYRFDRAGNLVERRDGQRDLRLVWDANQRLVESRTNGTVTRYGYDPLGRRIFKQTGDKRTLFYWDGDALAGEEVVAVDQPSESDSGEFRPEEPRPVREYVYYPQSFEPLAIVEGAPGQRRIYYYHNDPNGCPTRLTDAEGRTKWAVGYTAWGRISQIHVNEIDNRLRFQGQFEDQETGLVYNRSRYFDNRLGGFISQDPLGLDAGENPYWYAPNALNWIDALGLSCGEFPGDPNELTRKLGVEPKVSTTPDGTVRMKWEPNENTRIRFESHPHGLQPGDPGFNPRHHGEHYHVETKPSGMSWNQAKNQGLVTKAHPAGYTPGSGTGFLGGEEFPS